MESDEINVVLSNRTTNNLNWCPYDVKKKKEGTKAKQQHLNDFHEKWK